MGTAMAESLSSFTERLAHEHSVGIRQLLEVVRAHYLIPDTEHPLRRAGVVAGGWETATFASELANATGHPPTRHCALSPLRDVLPLLDSRSIRYCPQCVTEWLSVPDLEAIEWPVWRPSLWEFREVGACSAHRLKLIDHTCGLPLVKSRDTVELPGVCENCGSIGYRCRPACCISSEPHEDWVADQVGRAISVLSKGHRSITGQTIVRGVQRLHRAVLDFRKNNPDTVGVSRDIRPSQLKNNGRVFHAVISACMVYGFDLTGVLQGRLEQCSAPEPPEKYSLAASSWPKSFASD
ncbi:TniQ family protein [Paraburkholderia caribensis]|uniref:TniQ family protein n=1 Tax=Paraburkholderia caribensis TaxID=75105 RepID=UPI00398B6D15